MAITGTGTKADPYRITTYTDLRDIAEGDGTYWTSHRQIKYVVQDADIDCTDVTWSSMYSATSDNRYACLYMDMQNHYIRNITVNPLYSLVPEGWQLLNGSMLFITAHDMAVPLLKGINRTQNMMFVSDFNFKSTVNGHGQFEDMALWECNIKTTMTFPNTDKEQYVFSSDTGSYAMRNTNIEIHLENVNNSNKYLVHYDNNTSLNMYEERCRVYGTVKGTGSLQNFLGNNHTVWDTSVIDIDFRGCPQSTAVTLTDNTCEAQLSVINQDLLCANVTAGAGFTGLSTANIRNGAALTAARFPVTEV